MSALPTDDLIQLCVAGDGEFWQAGEQYHPTEWKVFFVQDCNLRCGYCCTGFGRFGHGTGFIQREVAESLARLMVSRVDGQKRIGIGFGGGETFLYFDEAMRFLDGVRQLAVEKQIDVRAQITTNGTVTTIKQLKTCLERRISLCFSIDGAASVHDAFRKFRDGRPTHRLAFESWQRYRDMAAAVADPPGCEVSSVVAGDARLADIAGFWKEHGVSRFKAIPAEPSRYLGRRELEEWQVRREQYLEDLKEFAFAESTRLRGRDFEREFEGPLCILDSWRRLNRAAPFGRCGAGYELIGVDADGALYPCQGFIGFPARSIGDAAVGVVPSKLSAFRSARCGVQSACTACWARFLCDGGCCAGDPETGVVLDVWNGCDFTQAHVKIAIESFHQWRDGSAPPA